MKKTCPTCGEDRTSEFYKDRHQSSGLSVYCKVCMRLRQRDADLAAKLDPVKRAQRLANHRAYSKSPKGRAAARRAYQNFKARRAKSTTVEVSPP